MLKINKGARPRCLQGLKTEMQRIERETEQSTQSNDWAPGNCAQPIRNALHRDQHGLCGYCMQRIKVSGHLDHPPPTGNGGMRIEHITTRNAAPTGMYDWNNLLGVCGGRSGAPGGMIYDHCDRARGNKALRLNPIATTPYVESVLSFSRKPPANFIGDTSEDALWVHSEEYSDDITTLQLNNPALRRGRRDAQKAIANILDQLDRRNRNIPKYLRSVVQTATTPDPDGNLPKFAAVVRHYAQQKLKAVKEPS